ncbi:Reverse transcriptase [Phytophthora palmivora]|uniref:Reverse transcriptase n=1 Tax=Phytophthora palmivora TaxID=4796 RepID=A0A2P4Y0Y8_9STRA|nr:Reverse transcriptase [Phytophthora palmivora]
MEPIYQRDNVEYLVHRVSKDGLETSPKDLEALIDLAFLDHSDQCYQDYAIYAAVLYELREVDFAVMSKHCVDPRWIRAHRAFETLKSKIASTSCVAKWVNT